METSGIHKNIILLVINVTRYEKTDHIAKKTKSRKAGRSKNR